MPVSAPVIKTTGGELITPLPGSRGDANWAWLAICRAARAGSDHLVWSLTNLTNCRAREKYFVELGAILQRYGPGGANGVTTSSLFRRSCRGGKSNRGGSAKTTHLTTFVESADSRPRARGGGPTPDAESARYRADTGRSGLSRSRSRGANAGRSGSSSCPPPRASSQAMLHHGLSDWTRTDMDARSLADLARRTAQHRRDDIESILAATRQCTGERNGRRSFSSKGTRGARLGVPSSRQGTPRGGLA